MLLTILEDGFQLETVVVEAIRLETIMLVETVMLVETIMLEAIRLLESMFRLNIALAKVRTETQAMAGLRIVVSVEIMRNY